MNVVALLESMWGWRGFNEAGEVAPRYFRINPDNHSGRRLYRLVGAHSLLVTNSCRVVQKSANHHGTPDPKWVRENIGLLAISGRMDLLLVCGKVAKDTFFGEIASSGGNDGTAYLSGVGVIRYLCIDHPAARRWSIEKLNQTQQHIERLLNA